MPIFFFIKKKKHLTLEWKDSRLEKLKTLTNSKETVGGARDLAQDLESLKAKQPYLLRKDEKSIKKVFLI